MGWIERLRPGSFRGVRFYTEVSEAEGGRRGSVLEFPLQDLPKTQDLGKAANRFTVEAFVIGADYDLDKQSLIEALEQGGPGKLIHRYFGEMKAEIEPGQKYRVVEKQDEGGMARFTIPFIRSPEIVLATVKIDSAARVVKAADKAKTASIESAAGVNGKLNVDGPEYVRTEVIGTMNRAINIVQGINDQVTGILGLTNQVNQTIKQFGGLVATLVATPGRLHELAAGGFGLFEAVLTVVGEVAYAHKKTIDAFSREPKTSAREEARQVVQVAKLSLNAGAKIGDNEPAITTDTARGEQRAQNQTAIVQLMQQANVIETTRAAISMSFDSNAAALAMRDTLVAELTAQAEATDDIAVFDTLEELRVEVSRHLVRVAGEAPLLRAFSPRTSLPMLLVAHLIHGDARREEELNSRNEVSHPGFVPGGYPLQYVVER